jgi:hypothetical protein
MDYKVFTSSSLLLDLTGFSHTIWLLIVDKDMGGTLSFKPGLENIFILIIRE